MNAPLRQVALPCFPKDAELKLAVVSPPTLSSVRGVFNFDDSLSLAAMHLLGLNWQLQPADGHTFNNGMRPGLPGAEDVATVPSGGRGEAAAPGARHFGALALLRFYRVCTRTEVYAEPFLKAVF